MHSKHLHFQSQCKLTLVLSCIKNKVVISEKRNGEEKVGRVTYTGKHNRAQQSKAESLDCVPICYHSNR